MSQQLTPNPKLFTLDKATDLVSEWKQKGEVLVFTNGCFDILHPGHVDYLQKAKNLGSKLILGLNSDDSVRRLNKGPERPLNSEWSRAFVLAGLTAIDMVVPFNEDTPLKLISALKPDILVKGGDYDESESDPTSKNYIVGKREVEEFGGSVKTIPFLNGFSTSDLVEKIKRFG
ncbi:D-glycero-beta-D-manno-heptose 1-phosphate adenylyltransferase [Luteibaculum oceani]|uniref:D-glycero-beta-D-manno-heptose 1-phosphate adenylyltransferase n=1 Tax=Luteibaculum oceani TaxID=1294296 RepID=A0A5C6V567_9FLAO|nr:D-glycero-beta-D-manno-heptose 1-phosphate adenylyltransferase [Luteibaculum oceani]TXC78978.1 D-glycero-beta-D-manno-heptose 1-phosphate adenylyltransferase [Luteibaculum oceani]